MTHLNEQQVIDSEQRASDMWRLADGFSLQETSLIQHNAAAISETVEKLQFALAQISSKEKVNGRSR
jgi:hypothetical protein